MPLLKGVCLRRGNGRSSNQPRGLRPKSKTYGNYHSYKVLVSHQESIDWLNDRGRPALSCKEGPVNCRWGIRDLHDFFAGTTASCRRARRPISRRPSSWAAICATWWPGEEIVAICGPFLLARSPSGPFSRNYPLINGVRNMRSIWAIRAIPPLAREETR